MNKNVEDIVVYDKSGVFSVSFSIASDKQEIRKSFLQRNRKWK